MREIVEIDDVQVDGNSQIVFLKIFKKYSTRESWMWIGSQLGATRQVGYNHLISKKREWNNCFFKN